MLFTFLGFGSGPCHFSSAFFLGKTTTVRNHFGRLLIYFQRGYVFQEVRKYVIIKFSRTV